MSSDQRPYSLAAERNREPILNELRQLLSAGDFVLEVGSGTAQHACYFADAMPQITWQPTETAAVLAITEERVSSEGADNIRPPLELDVLQSPWPDLTSDVVYSCNTFHIVSESGVEAVFRGAATVLREGGQLIVYGPFRFQGAHISDSNQAFDQQLRAENPERGIRDVTWLDKIAVACRFSNCVIRAMPANNHILVWSFRGSVNSVL